MASAEILSTAGGGGDAEKRQLHVPLYCYQKINRDVTDVPLNPKLSQAIQDAIPSELREANLGSALLQAGTAILLSLLGVWILTTTEHWGLIPLGWILLSLAMTSLFNIGHDSAHGIWTRSSLLNSIAGELSFLPLAHPFEAFRFKHLSVVHEEDSRAALLIKKQSARRGAAKPLAAKLPEDEEYSTAAHAMSMLGSLGFRGFFREHYLPSSFPASVRPRIIRSGMLSVLFFATFFTGLVTRLGPLSILHFWLIPLVLYKEIVYPLWLDWIRRGLNILLPAQVSQHIPSYHLHQVSRIIQRVIREHEDAQQQKEEKDGAPGAAAAEEEEDEEAHLEVEVDPAYGPFNYNADESAWLRNDWGSWLKRINWLHCYILLGTPSMALYGLLTTSPAGKTIAFTFLYYLFTGLGITAGYHRLWAHRSYQATTLVRWILCFGGSGALEGSIKWWCAGHRVHHRYTDTDYDPYSAKRGFWWSHIGWMLFKKNPRHKAKVDIRDLTSSRIVQFQHKNYIWMGPLWAFIVPALVCHFGWNDFWGGLFYAGALRLTIVHHTTFCVNSLAHWLGHHTYDDELTPRDHILTALITLGEGYHNFHHEFPNDYRNGIRFFDYDPTKWFIRFLNFFGLTYNLREFPANEVSKGMLAMKEKNLDQAKRQLDYGPNPEELPEMTWEEYQRRCREGKEKLLLIHGLIHDATHFSAIHPGGQALLEAYVGVNATRAFEGQTGPMYKHARAARNLLSGYRIARLTPGTEPVKQKKNHQKKAPQK